MLINIFMISRDLVAQIPGFPCFIFHTGTKLDISCQVYTISNDLKGSFQFYHATGIGTTSQWLHLFQIGQPLEVQLVR